MRRWLGECRDAQDTEKFGHARAALALAHKFEPGVRPLYREFGPGGPILPMD
jgi:hypothetical protein